MVENFYHLPLNLYKFLHLTLELPCIFFQTINWLEKHNSSLLKSKINSLNKGEMKLARQKSWPWATLKWGREKN